MFLEFEGITNNGEIIKSNCIIQKEMPYGIDIRLNVDTKWIRIKTESLKYNGYSIIPANKK